MSSVPNYREASMCVYCIHGIHENLDPEKFKCLRYQKDEIHEFGVCDDYKSGNDLIEPKKEDM